MMKNGLSCWLPLKKRICESFLPSFFFFLCKNIMLLVNIDLRLSDREFLACGRAHEDAGIRNIIWDQNKQKW